MHVAAAAAAAATTTTTSRRASLARDRLTKELLACKRHDTHDTVLGRLALPLHSAGALADTAGADRPLLLLLLLIGVTATWGWRGGGEGRSTGRAEGEA